MPIQIPYDKKCACGQLHTELPAAHKVCEMGIYWFQCQAPGCDSTLIYDPFKEERRRAREEIQKRNAALQCIAS